MQGNDYFHTANIRAMIKASNIKKNYGDLQVLKGVDIDIKKGEIPKDPTLYICAQGNNNDPYPKENVLGRFEIIINGSPISLNKTYNKIFRIVFDINLEELIYNSLLFYSC